MSQGAHVTSTEAIEAFRSALLVYLSKARPLLEDACDEVARTRQWLQHDRRVHWESQVRRCNKKLEAAEQALYSARLTNLREATAAEQMAVLRAKRTLSEAEEKLAAVKRWTLEFDRRAEPMVKQLDQLRTMLANDVPKAAVHLGQLLKSLAAYANVAPPTTSLPPPQGTAADEASGAEASPGDVGAESQPSATGGARGGTS